MVSKYNRMTLSLQQTWERFIRYGEIRPVFQPIVEMASGLIVGYEVLSRVYDKDGTLIHLEDLFSAAEYMDQLSFLDDRCFRSCLECIRGFRRAKVRFFINVLPQTLGAKLLYELLSEWIDEEEAKEEEPLQLVLEVCERTADPTATDWYQLLNPLRKLGVEVAIDDVGSGYAGLNRTVEMAPNWMKMDIGLVRGIDCNPMKAAMVASIVTFAKRMGSLHIIAEGVETQAEFETLLEMGVEYGQGYGFAKPAEQLLGTDSVALPSYPQNSPKPVDFARYGLVLTEYLQLVCKDSQSSSVLLLDIHQYIRQVMSVGHLEIFRIMDERVHSLNTLLSSCRSEVISPTVLEKLRRGQETVIQSSEDADVAFRSYIDMIDCKSSVIVPIYVSNRLYGCIYCGFRMPFQVRSEVISVLKGFAAVLAVSIDRDELLPSGVRM